MTNPSSERLVIVSALLALVSLGLMTSSVVSRGALAVIDAMSVGQGLGFLSLAFYGWALLRDLKRGKLLGAEASSEERS